MGRRNALKGVIHVTYFRHLLWNEMNYTSGSIDYIDEMSAYCMKGALGD